MKNYAQQIATEIKAARSATGLFQKEFAEEVERCTGVHLTQGTVYCYERGRRMPGADKYVAILDTSAAFKPVPRAKKLLTCPLCGAESVKKWGDVLRCGACHAGFDHKGFRALGDQK